MDKHKIASALISLAREIMQPAKKQATITDQKTLWQLIDMAAESSADGKPYESGDVKITNDVLQAAKAWDTMVEQVLLDWVGKNIEKFALGTGPLQHAKTPHDIVEVLMKHRGGAGYLYYMEAEGHGVGTWDGDWDVLFHDPDKTIKALSSHVKAKTRAAYGKLGDAIEAAGYAALGEEE